MQNTKNEQGFSLLELLIVVAIILIIATIAVPSFLRARQSANQSSAVANLRTMFNAEAAYAAVSGGTYAMIPQLVSEGRIDSRFTGTVSGYDYTVTTTGYDYTSTATPSSSNSGQYAYYMGLDGVVRYSTVTSLAPAGEAGNPVVQ